MRAVLQRVSRAKVTVDSQVVGQIETGWLCLLGVATDDTDPDGLWLAEKIVHLRAFADDEGKMNRSLLDIRGSILVVSNFTLHADCRKGRRPSFVGAASPEAANRLYEQFLNHLRSFGVPVQTGIFGSDMQIELINNGPVTMIVDTPN